MNKLLAGMLVSSLSIPGSASFMVPATASDDPARVELTARDISASNAEAASAYGALVTMWTSEFQRVGVRFVAPRIARYRGAARTDCGIVEPSNALYCPGANTIYFDEIFLAAQSKIVGRALGTDGDMAAVGIIAHEMGHAVAMQLGHWSRSSYENEKAADCLAGAFARHAQADGSLEAGDLDEAFYAMAAAGDPEPASTGDRRVDRRRGARVARLAHGTRDQRTQNFRSGLEGGGSACVSALNSPRT